MEEAYGLYSDKRGSSRPVSPIPPILMEASPDKSARRQQETSIFLGGGPPRLARHPWSRLISETMGHRQLLFREVKKTEGRRRLGEGEGERGFGLIRGEVRRNSEARITRGRLI